VQKWLHILLLLLLPTLGLEAQEAGLFNSPKGFGASFRFAPQDGVFHTATAFVDIYGVVTSRCSNPGVRANISRMYELRRWSDVGGADVLLYAGPGITAGFVRDHDKGRGIDLSSLVADNPGLIFALSGGAGFRFGFGGKVALDLSLSADAGIHIRRNEKEHGYTAASLSVFNNGLLQVLYPQLTILFAL